jgi:hypothetical protein
MTEIEKQHELDKMEKQWELENRDATFPLKVNQKKAPAKKSKKIKSKVGVVSSIHKKSKTRKPLTDEQIAEISVKCATVTPSDVYFARQLEAAHGIGARP